jgi:hypothetical protein
MPQINGAPAELNKLLEKVYASALKEYKGNKAKASKAAYAAAEKAGWKKDKEGKWAKEQSEYADVIAKDFVIFTAGTHNGENYTDADLDKMAASFNANEPPHIILGHSSDYKGKTMIPSYGRILGGLKRVGHNLVAMGARFNEQMADWIKDNFFVDRSIEMTRDHRVLAVGMLGAMPPAVKNMPLMKEVLREGVLAYSIPEEDVEIVELADGGAIDFEVIEEKAVENTIKNIDQEFATCLSDIENHLASTDEDEEIRQNCMDALMECYQNICEEIQEHFAFTGKLEELEPEEVESMMEKIKGWLHITSVSRSRKETDMDAKKEKEFQDKIAEQEAKLQEFAEKERLAAEAKAAEETARLEAAKTAALEAKKNEIKTFCDQTIATGKMTPAMREKDEPIMLTLEGDVLKSFQEKYTVSVVPLGETDVNRNNLAPEKNDIFTKAAKYVAANPKEFADLSDQTQKVNRAIYLQSISKIKFEETKKK